MSGIRSWDPGTYATIVMYGNPNGNGRFTVRIGSTRSHRETNKGRDRRSREAARAGRGMFATLLCRTPA